MIRPPPGAAMFSFVALNMRPTPSASILVSIRCFDDCASDFWYSRMQTARVPGSLIHSSTSSSAKKCDFPLPRPPLAPLYLIGFRSGENTRAVGMRSVDDNALDPLNDVVDWIVCIAANCKFVPVLLWREL